MTIEMNIIANINEVPQRGWKREYVLKLREWYHTAIAATSNKLEMPSYREGFDELYFVKNDGEKMAIEKWRDYDEI